MGGDLLVAEHTDVVAQHPSRDQQELHECAALKEYIQISSYYRTGKSRASWFAVIRMAGYLANSAVTYWG